MPEEKKYGPSSSSTKEVSGSSSSEFFNTKGGKTQSNAIEIPSITLPKGGGAIKGIDEKFSVNAVNGTASFSVPLPVSASRGLSPSLTLAYSSGGGNSIFGLGWNINLASIKRKTDKGLPQYLDDIESDTFLFSEAEDLVPEFKKDIISGDFLKDANGDYILNEKNSTDGLFIIRLYRPRIEGLFAHIERWQHKTSGEIKWRMITKDNVTTLFGWSAACRIEDPSAHNRIYEWFPEFVFDDKGNCAHYIYKAEDDAGFSDLLLHNRNRRQGGTITYTNLYLSKILYGNKTPYKKFGDAFPAETDFVFSIEFDYGEYSPVPPYTKIKDWDFRIDAFSDYKAGFEIRTTRLCKRVLLFHHFNGPNEYEGLVKSLNFNYSTGTQEGFTFLTSIVSFGYIRHTDGSYTSKSLPAMEFNYQKHDWNKDVKMLAAEDIQHVAGGLDEQYYYFTDLFNEGLSGILTEQANGWYYKHNLGEGHFEPAKLITPRPSFIGLNSQVQLADLDADGGKQLVSYDSEPKGYFELDDDNEWQGFRSFQSIPNISSRDSNTRMLDLNGDGKPEMVISEDNVFTWYPSEGRNGFSQAKKTPKPFDEEAGPHIVFADSAQGIFLADMSGDGLTDIVRIRNGEVCYWPNLGFGKFGAKVTMDNAPVFDFPDAFNPSYLKLADIDGSGTTDIIYLGKNKFSCRMNLNGNSFSDIPFEIDAFPGIDSQSKITVTDLLGNGVACIVHSSSLEKDKEASIKYVDLMNSKKPHIMVFYKNNMGKELSLEYTASTKFYIEDKLAGRPWITKLHFPVHCVSKAETRDKISGYRFVNSYKYHHGYYDHPEKEFRGFGMIEQIDTENFDHWIKSDATNIVEEELHQEPVISKSWFHTGAFLRQEKILTQFAHEYWYEEMARAGFPVVHNEHILPDARLVLAPGIDPGLADHLSTEEWREVFRACKGMGLRSEVFARDAHANGDTPAAKKKELTPYTVATHNCVIELLQPKGKNKHAVFVVKESEAITYNYERDTEDPRIAHKLNISFDEYSNVLDSASVVYPRLMADISLPPAIQAAQNKTVIQFSENSYTNDVISNDVYRLRLASEIKMFELKGVAKTGSWYSINDFTNILSASAEVKYYEIDKEPLPGTSQKRLIEHVRTLYYSNNLTGPLSLHQLDSLAFQYENYQLAYTPELITDIFGTKVNAALMTGGKFTDSGGDGNWWIRSGVTSFIEGAETSIAAQARFYLPVLYTDPFGSKTRVKYYPAYFLLMQEIEDELGNKMQADKLNFRTLGVQQSKDINGNLTEAIIDELGLVKAVAVFGKGNEADDLAGINEFTNAAETNLINTFFTVPDTVAGVTDSVALIGAAKQLLQHATSRFVYDFDVYKNTGGPAVAAAITREEHFSKNNNSPVQISFEYSNGMGAMVMKKVQAEPGNAKKVIVNPDDSITINEIDTSSLVPAQLRWLGNGRTVLNNKGKPVKQYEPYFSVTHRYEDYKELVETGVTPVIYYDAIGRAIKTKMPDDTLSRAEFNSWKTAMYDANDTILESLWYYNRTNRLIDAALLAEGKDPGREKIAADKAAKHAMTPTIRHFDTLGRPVLSVDHNKDIITNADEFYSTQVMIDAESNLRTIINARGNIVIEYKYDMLGNAVYQNSRDAGQRWLLGNILGDPLRTWDERDHEFQYFYDSLHRPLYTKVIGGDDTIPLDNIFQRIIYGEDLLLPGRTNEALLQGKNILGKIIKHFDTGGLADTPEYDFKGEPVSSTRHLFKNYKAVANWTDANLVVDLEAGASFTFITDTDALGRVIRQVTADGSTIRLFYNEASLLNGQSVLHAGSIAPVTYIKDIDYNEKGQRNKIIYGNDVSTKFYYDKQTFRLKRLESKRQNNDPLQDWYYTFDAAGNITHIEDKNIPEVFFNNQKVTGISEYTYDALYRLKEATGRENNAALLVHDPKDNWNDGPFIQPFDPGDPMVVREYTQSYIYDEAGNIKQMHHAAPGNTWTRIYTYEAANNRLRTTQVGLNLYSYTHHPLHGFITKMPHLEDIGWSFKEELIRSIKQKRIDGGTPETTYYQYDGQGQRIRKITENSANAGITPSKKEERIYIAGYELHKQYSGPHAGLERVSLSLIDGSNRFVMIETRNNVNDGSEKSLVRYQLNNHLGSASLELDVASQVISYEEYHPFGTTAFQANNTLIKAVAKRYRYTGMERDDETGLEYHSARYYLPWLGRWLNADPIGIKGGANLYRYSNNNPIKLNDTSGTDARITVNQATRTITYSTTEHYYGTQAEVDKFKPAAQRATEFFKNSSGSAVVDGKVWTVNYELNFQYHVTTADSPTPAGVTGVINNLVTMIKDAVATGKAPAMGIQALYADINIRSFETATTQTAGFSAGDNIVTLADLPVVGTTANGTPVRPSGVTISLKSFPTVANASAPLTNYKGLIALDRTMTATEDDLYRTLIHETGHAFGFDERYIGAGVPHEGYVNDFMSGNPSPAIGMARGHLDAAARFGTYIAKGKDIKAGVLRDFYVDDTNHGTIQEYTAGGNVNPAYTARQSELERQGWSKFREQFNPTPPPKLQIMPGMLKPDKGSPYQVLPKHDEQTMPGTIDLLRGRF